MSRKVGVLALQGDVAENVAAMQAALDLGGGGTAEPVQTARQIGSIDALIIPGGESTTMGALGRPDVLDAVSARAKDAMPMLGICAGLVLFCSKARSGAEGQPLLGLLDCQIERNAFGRQKSSFEADVDLKALGGGTFRAAFIRAPAIADAGTAEPVCKLGDRIVAVRKGPVLGVAFHPELGADYAVHRHFEGTIPK